MIDLDNDGNNDFEINFRGLASPGSGSFENTIISLQHNAIAVNGQGQLVIPYFLNDTISSELEWDNAKSILYNYYYSPYGSSSAGLWYELKDKYVGVMLKENNDSIYGWIRIDLSNYAGLILRDFAVALGNN